MRSYKVLFVGNAKTGKTSVINVLRGIESVESLSADNATPSFENEQNELQSWLNESREDGSYFPTLGVEVHPITLHKENPSTVFKIWDCAGDERFGGLREGYYKDAQIAFIFEGNKEYLNLLQTNEPACKIYDVSGSFLDKYKSILEVLSSYAQ
jgi:GTPase SAR1 family protein